jgi:NADPH:quinone reductase-like Zn-dependent oxidoreductase
MKAAVFREYDKDFSKVIKIEDIDAPKIKSNEVLIKVEAAAYNYNDLWAIWGDPIKVPMPHISGSDASGTVAEVGADVTTLKVGDRVVSHSNMSCRICDYCTSGREYDCPKRTIWGFQTGPLDGAYGQYAKLPEVNVLKIAENISFNDAAAVSMVGMTSWHMLVGRAQIKPGQTVLIMGGTSGVGMVGIQISKLYNCNVIATAGSKDKMDACLKLGADQVVNHREADWSKKVRDMTNKQGVDVVFEHIGKAAFPQEVALLKNGGTLVATGATTGYDSTLDLRYLFFKGTNLIGSTQGTRAELNQVLYWVSKGKIKPLVHEALPFSKVAEGHQRMFDGKIVGKLVTTPQKI